jgi:uncharacterized membrane protein
VSSRSKKKRPQTTPPGQPARNTQAKTRSGLGGTGDAAVATSDAVASGTGAAATSGAMATPSDNLTSTLPLRWVRWALVGLAFAGFLIAFYLTLTHYRNIIPPCYGTSGCEEVITSRYAVILGIPLALVGALFFSVMFYMGIALLTIPRPRVVKAYELLAYAGLLAAICLFLLQALVLKAYCTYCLTTEVIALLMWGGSFLVTSSAKKG